MSDVLTDDELIERFARTESILQTCWLVLGIIQVIACITAIAGVYNLFYVRSRLPVVNLIRQRDPAVLRHYDEMRYTHYLLGEINLFLGGVIGIVVWLIDGFFRERVTKHAYLFTGPTAAE
ncbi:MAG: hypothetical protein ACYDCO_27550 [Armatimonadota bacterium]